MYAYLRFIFNPDRLLYTHYSLNYNKSSLQRCFTHWNTLHTIPLDCFIGFKVARLPDEPQQLPRTQYELSIYCVDFDVGLVDYTIEIRYMESLRTASQK